MVDGPPLQVLEGSNIDQRGSIVGPDKLRFDFSYGKPMRVEELDQVTTYTQTNAHNTRSTHTAGPGKYTHTHSST